MSDDPRPITEAFEALVRPAARDWERGPGALSDAAMNALRPIQYLVFRGDEIGAAIGTELLSVLGDIPASRIVTPSPDIAGPLMDGLRYAVHDPDLRAVFVSLLATALDDETTMNVQPTFAEIARQITPLEAAILRQVAVAGQVELPMVAIRREHVGLDRLEDVVGSRTVLVETGGADDGPLSASYVQNLLRLGLFEEIEGDWGGGEPDDPYARLEADESVRQAATAAEGPGWNVLVVRALFRLTPLGTEFFQAAFRA